MKLPRLHIATWAALALGAGALTVAILLLAADKPWDIVARHGAPQKIKHFVAVYSWWAGAVNLLVLAALAGTARWWLRPCPPPPPWLPSPATPRWFWPLVAAAMGVTLVCGLQRITQGVWDDEEKSVRQYIVGEYRLKDGVRSFRAADWEDAFWNYRLPTNHHLQTILSKASHSIWRALTRNPSRHFEEFALRWPVLVAAIASIAAIALLLRHLGFARAGVTAAFLLALHPWHIRYAIELRGYMFTLLLGPLMVYCLLRAIDGGRWRWWAAFAAAEAALLYAYPGTLFMLVAANACGLAALWMRHGPADRPAHLSRMLVASTVAGSVWLQLMAPNIPQLAEYLKTSRALGALNARWHANAAAHFVSGIPWNNSDNASLGYPELAWQWGAWGAIVFAVAAVLFAAGWVRLSARRPAGWLAAVLLVVPAVAVYLMAKKNGNYLYEWYLIFALPGVCACVALALDGAARLLERVRIARRAAAPALVLAVLGFGLLTQPARGWLLTHPLQPTKDTILAIRPSLDPKDPRQDGILTASLGTHFESYDPNILSAKDVDTVTLIARDADRTGRPFFIVTGNDLAVAIDYPELRAFLQDPRHFELVEVKRGYDPTLTQTIRKYRPGSLSP